MLDLKQWDVWEADVPFEENVRHTKRRPVVIIDSSLVLVLKLTTHNSSDKPRPFEYELSKWAEAGLSKKTFVQCDRLIRLSEENFTGNRIGRIHLVDMYGIRQMAKFHGLSI